MVIGVSNRGTPEAQLASTQPRRRRKAPLQQRVRHNVTGYAFLIGAILCFTYFSWYPMVKEAISSFQYDNAVDKPTWVGWANYSAVWHDPSFVPAWKATVTFALMALVLGYAVPFITAIILNEFRHASAYFRLLVYLPVMLPPAAGAFLFKYFYDPDAGLFNTVLRDLHLPTMQWIYGSSTAMFSLVLFSTWINMGSGTLIYLAALQGIPGELYEAAELDGAGLLRRIWTVTIPQTRLILSLMLMLQIVATMQVFLEPYLLTSGGPGGVTATIVYQIYQYAVPQQNIGYSAALGIMLLLVLAGFAALYLWISNRSEKE
ncbi:MAG: multiple sugar transport system permease protein [Frankiales bacterium]|nr:multiple sugar transport system permease protein [Frankiales bacterium]